MNLQFLGAPEDVSTEAWNRYFVALRDRTRGDLGDMLGAYRTYKRVRESFGLVVTAPPGEAARDPGALTDSQFQQMLELASMADVGVRALDDAIAGRRKVAYDRAAATFQIERLPGDEVRIEERTGRPTVVSNVTNQPVQITGTIEGAPTALGLAPIAWVALGVAGVVVTVGTLYTVNTAMESATSIVQAHTAKTIHMKNAELAEKGIDPQGAAMATKAVLDASADLKRAEGEAAGKAGLTPDTNKTIRTVAIVGLVGAGLYLISKFIPQRRGALA